MIEKISSVPMSTSPSLTTTIAQSTSKTISSTSLLSAVILHKMRKPGEGGGGRGLHGEGISEHLIFGDNILEEKHFCVLKRDGEYDQMRYRGNGERERGERSSMLPGRVCLFRCPATEKSLHRSSYQPVTCTRSDESGSHCHLWVWFHYTQI